MAKEYRRRSLNAMLRAEHPPLNIDGVHREQLETLISDFHLEGFSPADREAIVRTWHQLECWPDFPPALRRLRTQYLVVSFTILSTSLIIDISRRNDLNWDAVISCEMIGIYRTRPGAYLTNAKWLQLDPSEIMMVACHNFDLDAERECGYRTAFVRRPDEWGAGGPPDPVAKSHHDVIGNDFCVLADRLGV